jgi:hypothetical protein
VMSSSGSTYQLTSTVRRACASMATRNMARSCARKRPTRRRSRHEERAMTCGFNSFVRALAFLLGIAVVASPIDASAVEHVSMIQYVAQHGSTLGFTQDDVKRFVTYGNVIPACAEVARAFPDMSAVPHQQVRHVIRRQAVCRAGPKSRNAGLGVFRVEDSLLGLTCVSLRMMEPAEDLEPACNNPLRCRLRHKPRLCATRLS